MAAAWAQGVTGKNVTTAIMDDGKNYLLKRFSHAIFERDFRTRFSNAIFERDFRIRFSHAIFACDFLARFHLQKSIVILNGSEEIKT